MPHYFKLGQVPPKRHTVFRKPNGDLYAEQLISTEGFSDVSTLAYHCYPPTMVKHIEEPYSVAPIVANDKNMQHRSFKGFNVQAEDDYLDSRVPVLVNNDVYLSLAAPRKSMTDYFFKNSQADEVIFIHKGSGVVKTIYGQLPFKYGDHVVIPRGTIYQVELDQEDNRFFIIESFSPIRYPKRYVNDMGQLLEHSPYCERDIVPPSNLETFDEKGDFKVLIKRDDMVYPYHMATHPFDLVGWDGYHYPFIFSIHNFEPITGRVHQPPPVHQSFEAHNFVICAFVPRLYDYHPESIPAPYNHSNVDSDEVLYYVDGDFMSRKSVEKGQITLHPTGIPHGPHPGTVEKSIGAKETQELAVMVDTFKPLKITEQALKLEDRDYYKSWLK
ncbi:homogentisate 1,2-dioxygenase [Carboxylicivirga sp. N1Y90]|uniref:homogentisate 1,2-dioxygenase n=1 Tax=Carboxylicivirga fragile TaxID=3417571 RepID=UPI003D328D2C|nr:homogentisate 1,2-dioxygenase [Marinilabiliaceae bacterium N1Y90]